MNIYDRGKDAGKETAFRRTTSKTSGHAETVVILSRCHDMYMTRTNG